MPSNLRRRKQPAAATKTTVDEEVTTEPMPEPLADAPNVEDAQIPPSLQLAPPGSGPVASDASAGAVAEPRDSKLCVDFAPATLVPPVTSETVAAGAGSPDTKCQPPTDESIKKKSIFSWTPFNKRVTSKHEAVTMTTVEDVTTVEWSDDLNDEEAHSYHRS